MTLFTPPIERLIDLLRRLPGIGPKSAQRMAFHLLRAGDEYAEALAAALTDVRQSVHLCQRCNAYTVDEICEICQDGERDAGLVCVVERPFDVAAFERTRQYRGLYHVLHGTLSPIDGIGPDDLKLRNLLDRVKNGEVREVIVATNPDVEGEATAIYLARTLKPLEVTVTRLALGLPVGSDLEYTDELTLARALDGRTPY